MKESIEIGMTRNWKENWYSVAQPAIQWKIPGNITFHGILSLFCQFGSISDQQWPGTVASLISLWTCLSTQHQNTVKSFLSEESYQK